MNNLDIKTDSLIAGGNKKTKTSTNSGGHENLGRRYESMEHNRGGGSVIVNKGSIIVNVNKNVSIICSSYLY